LGLAARLNDDSNPGWAKGWSDSPARRRATHQGYAVSEIIGRHFSLFYADHEMKAGTRE
jgi:hypothetical protein